MEKRRHSTRVQDVGLLSYFLIGMFTLTSEVQVPPTEFEKVTRTKQNSFELKELGRQINT